MRTPNTRAIRLAASLAAVVAIPAQALTAQTPLSTAAIAGRGTPATVTIVTFDALGNTLGQGSGFFFHRPDGTLLTNWHVMAGAYSAHVILVSGRRYQQVTVLEADSVTDLAILKVSGSGLPAPVARSTVVPAVGERVVVIGSPLGLSHTVSEGIVSARRLVDGREFVQISAAISPGSSGGPVLDGQGRVFAVAMGTLPEGQQLNFAVPVRYAVLMLLRHDLRMLDGPQVERRLDAVFGSLAPVKDAPVKLTGDWLALAGDEIRHIMVRSDSSAQFGSEVARWRVVGDSLWITQGDGVWQVYGMMLSGEKLTISGGDLEKPVTLKRVGPATARPDSLAIPEAPAANQRAW